MELWRKHIPLKAFESLFTRPDVQVVALQHGYSDEEAALSSEIGVSMEKLEIDPLGDTDKIFACVSAMNGFLSVPNTNAHIAAACGVKTAVLMTDLPSPLWGAMRSCSHYPLVGVFQKPVCKRDDGLYEWGWGGDWSRTVKTASDWLLSDGTSA